MVRKFQIVILLLVVLVASSLLVWSQLGWSEEGPLVAGTLTAETQAPQPAATILSAGPSAVASVLREAAGQGWEPAGFGGAGNFLSVHVAGQPGVIYATSDVAGLFRSTDGGDRWQMRNLGLGNVEVSSFAIDPFDPNRLCAGTGAFAESSQAGIYVSQDAGQTWQHLTSTATNRITFRKYRTMDAIALDPAQQGVLVSGSRDNGIWRSTDGGTSWNQVYAAPVTSAPLFNDGTIADDPTGGSHPAPVAVVVFDPVISTTVYAALDGFGVVKSTARGVAGSWQPATTGLPGAPTVKDLAVGSENVLYTAVGPAGVYKSTDGGSHWQPANGGLPLAGPLTAGYGDPWVSSVAVDRTEPDTAYLTLVTYDFPSVWKTTDGGATWVAKGDVTYDAANDPTRDWATGPTANWQVTLDRANPNRLFFADYWSIQRSDDGGEHWVDTIAGAQNTCVTDLVVDTDHPAGQPDTLYATHMDAGLLKSTDRGTSWTAVLPNAQTGYDEGLAGHYWNVAIARIGGVKYYYATSDPWSQSTGQVLRSQDGINWAQVFTNPRPAGTWMEGAMMGLAVDPGRPSILYVTQDGGQVWKSADSGTTWAPTTGQPGGSSFTYALAVDATGRVFAGTLLDGLWRSTDGGASWQRVLPEQSTIFHVTATSGAVYTSTGDANLYRSTDGGEVWQRLTNFSATDDGDEVPAQGMAIAVDPNDPAHLLFSLMDTWHPADASPGIVASTDDGTSWAPLNAGLGLLNVSALAAGSDGGLFAGTWCGGIWRRPASATPPAATPTATVTPPISACAGDSDGNGRVNVVDIMATAQTPGCWLYLPLLVRSWRQPWPASNLSAVNDFLYQLQNLDLAAIGATAYDLVVMDSSADGTEEGEFSAAEISTLKQSPGGEKIVLAYMSIGEAEDYRFYWQDGWAPGTPAWLDVENPDWPGNYKVHYWDPAWQAIIFAYTDRLLDAGFDGAYLDIIDAYEFYADQGRTTAAQEMADFVAAIRAHARARDPDFLIFPQNAPELATVVPAYLTSVDGIGQEELYYGYAEDDVMTLPAVSAGLEGYLDLFKDAGKLVLTVDYATTPARVDDAYTKSQARGYVPFATVRDLDRLTINTGHEPD
ncbi:MAG: endo alpha-1,4 polygalactosaminidase [Ardenticatenaceae bacterium]|nr:endo alpha-1,4 polygalactosaminidase [Ardenticatenaceae bacterium]